MMNPEKGYLVSMNREARHSWVIITLLIFLLLPGCLNLKRETPSFYYYTLEYATPKGKKIKPLRVAIQVERFLARPPYDTDRMIIRNKAFQRTSYSYHRWREKPAQMASFLLARDLRKSGAFRDVYREYHPDWVRYRLTGVIEDFLEWDKADQNEAVLRLRIILTRRDLKTIRETPLMDKTYHAHETVTNHRASAMAAAMSRAMKDISRNVIHDVYEVIAQ